MHVIRRRLFAIVLLVVAGQVAGAAATSVVLGQTSGAEVAAHLEIACTCVHGANAECPMHKSHKAAVPTDASSRGPRFCNGGGDSTSLVLTLLFAGPVVSGTQAVVPESTSEPLTAIPASPIDLVLSLVSPPPRA